MSRTVAIGRTDTKGECPKIEYTAMVWHLKENRLL